MNKDVKTAVSICVAVVVIICAFLIVIQMTGKKAGIAGFDKTDATAANFRWALFEQWVKAHPQCKNWESDPEVFRQANEEFRKNSKMNVEVVK